MKLTLQLSCYNGARYLPYLFSSLRRQTLREWNLVMLDNASTPEEAEAIKHAVSQAGFPIEFFRVEKNIGFAGAHNYLFEKHKDTSDYVALANDDAILEPDYLLSLLNTLEVQPELASVSGVIYRWNFDERSNASEGKTETIDTLGLAVSETGAVNDIAAGETFTIDPTRKFEYVFGVSGCLPMYRMSAIKQVRSRDTLFHPNFVMYKEDVELAFRLRAAGYKAATVPQAIAYHRRSLGPKVKHKISSESKYQSYRNHLWTHIIHTSWPELFSCKLLVWPYEFLKCVFWLLKKPTALISIFAETKTHWNELAQDRAAMKVLRNAKKQRHNQPPIVPKQFDAEIVIVTVSHNEVNAEALDSLEQVRKTTRVKTAVVFADNASTKYDAHALIKSHIPDAIVLLRNGDFGFGRSCNRGADELTAKYYFFLNPDTVLTDPDMLNKMYDYMELHQEVGVIGPKVFYFDGRLQETCRRFPKWFMPFVQRTSLKNSAFGKAYAKEFTMEDNDHNHVCDVDWMQGSALFVNGDVWRTVAGFDHRYWLYFEDIDLCRKIHTIRKRVVYFPEVTMKHAHGKESATYQNLLVNLIKKKEARGHIVSWIKYTLKWLV